MANKNSKTPQKSWTSCSGWIQQTAAAIWHKVPRSAEMLTQQSNATDHKEEQEEQSLAGHGTLDGKLLAFPQICVPAPQSHLYRRKSLPPMPIGEHSVAARSRLRAKSERRATQRRNQPMRSNRSRSSSLVCPPYRCETTQPEDAKIAKTIKQRDKPTALKPMNVPSIHPISERHDLSEEGQPKRNSSRSKAKSKSSKSRKVSFSPLIPLRTIMSPIGELFGEYTSLEWTKLHRGRVTSSARKQNLLNTLLISPKTRFPNPTEGMISSNLATTFTNSIPVSRKKKDTSGPAVSSSYHLWHVVVDGKGPTILIPVNGRRGSGWTIETPTHGKGRGHNKFDSLDSTYHFGLHGQRRYDRNSGYWGWSQSVNDS